ncbi:uncharacterized protein LOC110914200 [Helianthus annuus]|uniref:uncharacterized protein LOC110914200 n=1 Tax=Helianthus annuus TaxID=4232 RepID=UPI000B900557|nr:uncharacterized protein LOC110914200 [Helianthus annuus]
MDSKLHPALTVGNIKHLIPLTLELETTHYTSWSALFQNHCRAYQVYDHLEPKSSPTASSSGDKTDAGKTDTGKPDAAISEADALWIRLDAIVLQWIYGTISTDLLHTILAPGQAAYDAWTLLANLLSVYF